MVPEPLLWQPPEPQYRPTAVESMSSRTGDMHECDMRRLSGAPGTLYLNVIPQLFTWHTPQLSLSVPGKQQRVSNVMQGPSGVCKLSRCLLDLDNCCQGQISAIRPARQSAEPSRHPDGPDCPRRLRQKPIGGAVLGGGGVGARVREHRKTR